MSFFHLGCNFLSGTGNTLILLLKLEIVTVGLWTTLATGCFGHGPSSVNYI